MNDFVTHHVDDNIGIVTIDRSERLNALGTPVLEGLEAALEELETRGVTAVILRTAGDRAFVAGADLKELVDFSIEEFRAYIELQGDVNDDIEDHSAVVISEVDALALGGGFELALATDLIVAGERAEFGFPEIDLGMIPGGGGTQRIARIVGPNKAKELVVTGESITAAEGERLGVVNRVVPDGELTAATRELAETIAAKAPLAVEHGKRAIDEGLAASLATGLSHEQQRAYVNRQTEDAHEGVRAFLEDRDPDFEGR